VANVKILAYLGWNGMAMLKGCQRREGKEDVQEKRGWKEYKQP
jgi:hypothetical protein